MLHDCPKDKLALMDGDHPDPLPSVRPVSDRESRSDRLAISMDFLHTIDMPGKWYQAFFEVASDQFGFITSEDARELGGHDGALVDMARAGQLDRTARGLYRFRSYPTDARDELMAATLWPRRLGVISHDSALDLWDLCDINPARIHVTVPKSARLRRRTPPTYEVHERDLDPGELSNIDGIPVVTPLRAILDGIERHLDRRLVNQAIDNANRRGLLLPGESDLLSSESR